MALGIRTHEFESRGGYCSHTSKILVKRLLVQPPCENIEGNLRLICGHHVASMIDGDQREPGSLLTAFDSLDVDFFESPCDYLFAVLDAFPRLQVF